MAALILKASVETLSLRLVDFGLRTGLIRSRVPPPRRDTRVSKNGTKSLYMSKSHIELSHQSKFWKHKLYQGCIQKFLEQLNPTYEVQILH